MMKRSVFAILLIAMYLFSVSVFASESVLTVCAAPRGMAERFEAKSDNVLKLETVRADRGAGTVELVKLVSGEDGLDLLYQDRLGREYSALAAGVKIAALSKSDNFLHIIMNAEGDEDHLLFQRDSVGIHSMAWISPKARPIIGGEAVSRAECMAP